MHGDDTFDDEELTREGGTFVRKNGGREVGCDEEYCPVDEVVDQGGSDDGVPGTADDLPYDYGLYDPTPTDQQLPSIDRRYRFGVGETGEVEDVDTEPPLGQVDERDLWQRQKALIDEQDEEVFEPGRSDEEMRRIAEASGEEVQEVLPESPEGKSSTGNG